MLTKSLQPFAALARGVGMSSPNPSTVLLLVDGTCIFCNRLVAFFLRHDRHGVIRFAHLQGQIARDVLARHGLQPDIDVLYAVTHYGEPEERVHLDGAAGRVIWPRISRAFVIMRFVPLFLLNLQYKLFAKLRYRMFGQASTCILPAPELRTRFLD
jgi:predicted DCC family thiol-disulfide oxidoreductase YuxK